MIYVLLSIRRMQPDWLIHIALPGIVLALDLKKARSPGHGRSPVQLQARIGQKPEHPL